MNWLDRAIAAVAPRAALDRQLARIALARAYDAARPGNRRIEPHRRRDAGPRGEVQFGAAEVRRLVRDLVRNNGYARKAHAKLVSSTIGTGITGSVTAAGGRPANRQLRDAWARFVDEADWNGEQDLNGLQLTLGRALFSDGDVLLRRYWQQFDANTRTPPARFQVLEADYIDTGRQAMLNNDAGVIDRGIEYDAQGRKVALWLWPDHPLNLSSTMRNRFQSQRVPIGDVVQVYDMMRPGQDRGVSIFSAAIMPLNELAAYLDREAMRKNIEACLAGFVVSAEPPGFGGADVGIAAGTDAAGNRELAFEPGMITRLKPGEDFRPGPVAPVGDMGPFIRQMAFLAAAGVGVMYEHMTGDMSGVNYSSYRVGSFDFAQFAEQQQHLVLLPRMCRMMGRAFLEGCGMLQLPAWNSAAVRWTPPRPVTSPDPEKDARANKLELDMFTRTLSELAAERGWTLAEMAEQIKADRELIMAQLGVDPLQLNAMLRSPAAPAAEPPAPAQQEGSTDA